jgi:hypothetical protein
MSQYQTSFSKMMETLTPYFTSFYIAGIGLLISLSLISFILIKLYIKKLSLN